MERIYFKPEVVIRLLYDAETKVAIGSSKRDQCREQGVQE